MTLKNTPKRGKCEKSTKIKKKSKSCGSLDSNDEAWEF